MASETESGKKGASWTEHTVVANFPRVLPRAVFGSNAPAPEHPAFSQAEEPLTVIGEPPSRSKARELIARYAALNDTAPGVTTEVPSGPPMPSAEPLRLPLRRPFWERIFDFVRDDFQRAPRIVRLLVPALPLVALATTILDRDPPAAAHGPPVAVAPAAPAASAAQVAAKSPPSLVQSPGTQALAAVPLPSSSVPVGKKGRTLQADAADAAARGDRARAIALYAELAREQPNEPAYASAAHILMRDEARERPRAP
jgi:hypothetical protein